MAGKSDGEEMKIYCLCCKKHILETNEKFVVGGPYNGSMFNSVSNMPLYNRYPRHESIVKGNLQCPWCEGVFCGPKGEIVTEYGRLKPKQRTYDPEFSIIYKEGELKGRLKYIKEAPEKEDLPESKATNVEWLSIEELKEMSENVEKRIEAQSEEDPRKLKVYELSDKGMSNKEIGKAVGVTAAIVGNWLKAKK